MPGIYAELKTWHPDKEVSKGAAAYHNAVADAPYYVEIIDELVDIAKKKIKENVVVVDFGAGTGVSALRLLKKIKINFKLWLVDNSAAWLGKAHEVLGSNKNVKCFLLSKVNGRYATLAETIGEGTADNVISANTVHLIPDLEETFKGIWMSLKKKGNFIFQSANIIRDGRKDGALMVDSTINKIHEIALDIVRTNDKFKKYRKDLDKRIEIEGKQRKFVFPEPRHLSYYLRCLESAGFEHEEPHFGLFKIAYRDWLEFLRVKRLQAGILPEICGKEATSEEERDRDELIVMASGKLFDDLAKNNPMADATHYTIECIYVTAVKK